ncbi:MAG: GNAT family protein [Bacteroidota bacterium]
MSIAFEGFEISPIHLGDAWKICDFVVTNEKRLKRYFPKTLEQNLTPSLSQLFVERKFKAFENKTEFLYTIKQIGTKKLAGLIYIKNLDWNEKRGELAYCLDYSFKGQQLMSKAIKNLIPHAFNILKLEHLIIIAHKENYPSIKVAVSNGFKWTATLHKEYTPPGEKPLDMELYDLYQG